MEFLKRAWAEINLDNAKENYKTIIGIYKEKVFLEFMKNQKDMV